MKTSRNKLDLPYIMIRGCDLLASIFILIILAGTAITFSRIMIAIFISLLFGQPLILLDISRAMCIVSLFGVLILVVGSALAR